jgi:SAM-dependent methyltransferase
MGEIDLMVRYPKTKRGDIIKERQFVTEEEKRIARKFGKEYFDGERRLGLGGYYYNPKYFKPVVDDMIQYYELQNGQCILDVGCAKGFMLHDFKEALPGLRVFGIDISTYCIEHSMPTVKEFLSVGSCDSLPYRDNSFDLVISIATIHNLDIEGVRASLREINRVSRRHAFVKVNGFSNEEERESIAKWNLVAKTNLSVEKWKALFKEEHYDGDYYWFTT